MEKLQLALNEYARVIQCSLKEAKEDFENDVQNGIRKGLTKERATAEWIAENLDLTAIEELTEKAKVNGTEKVVAKSVDAYGKKRTRVKKVNSEKVDIINALHNAIEEIAENLDIVNDERTLSFTIGENSYSVNLTCHRKAKTK